MRATLALNWLNRNPVDRKKGRANNANEVTEKLTTYNANVLTMVENTVTPSKQQIGLTYF